jgi:hypothetical protein
MLGKYLNGYQPQRDPAAPGWSEWDVAGNGYRGFNFDLNQNGKIVHYASRPEDYMTDVLSAAAVNFIRQQTSDTPFLIEIATFAPHAPYTPAPRDADAFAGLRAPRTGAFDAAPDRAAPKWLAGRPQLSEGDEAMIDNAFRKRAQSVLAVDAMIGELQRAVAAIGAADNTYFVFSSDNGYHMGEHRLMPGKMTAYDTDIHVPLIVTGPGVAAGRTVDEIVQNIDLCPMFTELGFASTPNVDGRSLAPLLRGNKVEGWRTVALVEHRGPIRDLADPDLPDLRNAPNRRGDPAGRQPDDLRGDPLGDLALCRIRRWREGIPRPRGGSLRAAEHLRGAAGRPQGGAARCTRRGSGLPWRGGLPGGRARGTDGIAELRFGVSGVVARAER